MPRWLLVDVAVAEAVLLLLAWAVVLGHGVIEARRRGRLQAQARIRGQVTRGMLHGRLPDETRRALEALDRSGQREIFLRLAANVRGRERAWLGELARSLGLVDHARRLCTSRFWWRRLRGVRLLTHFGGPDSPVLSLAEDPHPLIRSQVAEWCGAHPTEAAVHTLVTMLGDRSQASRFAVQDALVRMGGNAVEPLARRLSQSEDERELAAGLQVAGALGDPRLAPEAIRYADHPSPAVRAAACRVLGATGGARATDHLEVALADEADDVRAAAALALGELGHWTAGGALAKRLADPSWKVRSAAGRALGRLGPPGEVLLRRALTHPDPFAADMARHTLDLAALSAGEGR